MSVSDTSCFTCVLTAAAATDQAAQRTRLSLLGSTVSDTSLLYLRAHCTLGRVYYFGSTGAVWARIISQPPALYSSAQ